jgi:FkbM family methyltransferase
MTIQRALIRAFDRPGGRGILGTAVTQLARRNAPGVRVRFYRGMWVHQEGDIIFVDSPFLDYHPTIFRAWNNELNRCLAETADHWFHAYQPQPGDTVLDIGAGKGEDTIAFSRAVGPQGKIIAVEAHPVTFGCLRLFCEWNRLGNVVPINFAISDHAGPVAIESNEGWQANRIGTVNVRGSARTPGITLDELVARENLKRIDFLKMNIEGAEALAVRGLTKAFAITRVLCISCHNFLADVGQGDSLRTKAAVREAVQRSGFRVISRDGDPRPYIADQINAVRE